MPEKQPLWRRPTFLKCVVAPAASAFLILAAYAPLNFRPLVFVALVPWLLAFPYDNKKQAWRAGLVFNAVFILGQMFFVAELTDRWTHSPLLALLPWLICGVLGAIYFGPMSLVLNWCIQGKRWWLVPLVWALVEVWRSYMPVIAFPWGLIATPLATYPALINSALLLTVYGVGAWIVLGNVAVVALLRKQKPYATMGVFGAILGISVALYLRPIVGTPTRVVAGQPGVDMAFTPTELAHSLAGPATQRILDVARTEHAELTVLPEGLVDIPSSNPVNLGFTPSADTPMLFGAQRGKKPSFQSAYTFDGQWHYADKTRLVIFGEFVPSVFRMIPFLSSFDLPSGDLQAGDKVTALKAGRLTVGPIICFEEMFPDVCYKQRANGAQLLAIISMDDWFRGTPAFQQLRDSCVFRAIETNLPVVRSTTTGYSAAIDQRGRFLAIAEPGGWAALPATIQVRDPR